MYPPESHPKRLAYLKYTNLTSGDQYCQYGLIPDDVKPSDCAEVPVPSVAGASTENKKYRPEVLAKCLGSGQDEGCSLGIASALTVEQLYHKS